MDFQRAVLFKAALFVLLVSNCRQANAEYNLALHKRYTYRPAPNYRLCTDSGDVVQLTDGRRYGSYWTKKSTVGWRRPEPAVEIVIDLGRPAAIYRVRIHTIGGGFANVEFPEYAAVLVSEDGQRYGLAALRTTEELRSVRARGFRGVPRSITISDIDSRGRYVKLVIRARPDHLFLDEIEVIGEVLGAARMCRAVTELSPVRSTAELLDRIEDYLQIRANIEGTLKALQSWHKGTDAKRAELVRRLEALTAKVPLPSATLPSSEAMGELEKQVGLVRAALYRQVYDKPLPLLAANPMEILLERHVRLAPQVQQLEVRLWQGEYEAAAFNVVNAADQAQTVSVEVSPLQAPGTQPADSSRVLTIRRAVYVRGATVGMTADALVLQGSRPFRVAPGQVAQIWLTIFDPNLKPGTYTGTINVKARQDSGQEHTEQIALRLVVEARRFARQVALNTCNWGCYRLASLEETAEDFKSHHINVYLVNVSEIPFPRKAADGTLLRPDYTKIDRIIRKHPFVRTFLLFLNFRASTKDSGRFGKWMSPQWKRAFAAWLKQLREHLQQLGLGYERWALHCFDESLCDAYYELARFVKSVDPKIRLYANSFGKGPKEFLRFRNLIDIWCPQDSHCTWHPDWLRMIQGFGKELWTYDCAGPGKANDPYTYYRLMPWRAFARGQTGAGFWVYHDGLGYKNVAVPWDETLKPFGYYGVVYGAQTSPIGKLQENIVPSRRWEAWREGVEDYQYLYELQQAIRRLRVEKPAAADEAAKLLETQVQRVLREKDNCAIVYEARRAISEMLLRLSSSRN